MIIEVIGSYASIIGLSMQVIERFSAKHDTPVGKSMATLKALSITGKTWKNVHMKYHAIDRNLSTILSALETINNGRKETLSADRVNTAILRDAFNEPNWLMYLTTLESQLQPSMDTLKYANEKASEFEDEALHALRDNGLLEIAERVQTIVISQRKIVDTHESFINFLTEINKAMHDEVWDLSHVDLVLKNRILLNTQIPMIIGNTDNALMALLDLYNFVIDEVEN